MSASRRSAGGGRGSSRVTESGRPAKSQGDGGERPIVPRSGAGRELASGNVSGAGFHESSRYGKRERREGKRRASLGDGD